MKSFDVMCFMYLFIILLFYENYKGTIASMNAPYFFSLFNKIREIGEKMRVSSIGSRRDPLRGAQYRVFCVRSATLNSNLSSY